MLQIKQWIVTTTQNDATLKTLFPNNTVNVYPVDVDITPENFPVLTYQDIGDEILTHLGAHIGIIQLNIWSKASALEVENIYDRLQQIFNLKDTTTISQTFSGLLFWIKQTTSMDLHTPQRRIWHKQMDLKYWVIKSDGS